jgi:hypothetical protein
LRLTQLVALGLRLADEPFSNLSWSLEYAEALFGLCF